MGVDKAELVRLRSMPIAKLNRDGVALARRRCARGCTRHLTGAAVLLGRSGVAACMADAERMSKPLTIVLVEHEDPQLVSWLITTLEIVLH